jgi:hypothetical protein
MSETLEQTTAAPAGHAAKYTRNNPYISAVTMNYRLTSPCSLSPG